MTDYRKPWLSTNDQIQRLKDQGLTIENDTQATALLQSIGYYRISGYLYPFRHPDSSEEKRETDLGDFTTSYIPSTTLEHARDLIDFDRRLRLHVMEGVERIEVAVRTQIAHVLGERSRFAHEDCSCFTEAFCKARIQLRIANSERKEEEVVPGASKHVLWLQKVKQQLDGSKEAFITHFRDKYDGQIPIWALIETLELGMLFSLYQGMLPDDAEKVALYFGVPTKRLMSSWLATVNYIRNLSAHHARLFNRNLQNAPQRPKSGAVPLLEHIRSDNSTPRYRKPYNALAIIAYLLRSIDGAEDWASKVADLLREFPESHALTIDCLGAPPNWDSNEIWAPQ